MSADAWLSMPGDMTEITETTRTTSADALSDAELTPRPLEEGERIELWLAGPPAVNETAAGAGTDTGSSAPDGDAGEAEFDGWDVRPAQVSAVALPFVAVAAGGWGMTGDPGTPDAANAPGATGTRVILRRLGGEGIAEWEGTIATGAEAVPQSQLEPQAPVQHAAEAV